MQHHLQKYRQPQKKQPFPNNPQYIYKIIPFPIMHHKASHYHPSSPQKPKPLPLTPTSSSLLHYGSMNTMSFPYRQQKQHQYAMKNSSNGAIEKIQYCWIGNTGWRKQLSVEDHSPREKKINKYMYYHEQSQYKDNNYYSRQKKQYNTQNQKSILCNLKQTSSTTSASTMTTIKKPMPSFLKNKSKLPLIKKSIQPKFNKKCFLIHKKLAQGKFGRVYLVQQLLTGLILAMKVVQKKKITVIDGFLEQFIRQLKIQMYLKHPNIIQVYGYFQDDLYFYTLMQYGCDGQLYNLLRSKKKLSQESTAFITKNLLQAVDHMHKLNILHRDLKPENIVRIMGNVKICDFGWAVNKLTKQELRSTYCGTPLYLSPELLKGQKYDQKVDIWAIGILAYELLLGKSPFEIYQHEDLYKILTDEVRFPPNKKISKQFQQFISHILNKNPKQRLSSSQLLQLKFIRKYEAFETCEELCQ